VPVIFGNRAPRPLQWWAPFVYASVFAVVAALLTYGTMTWGAPPDRGGTATQMWFVIASLWAIVALGLVQGTVVAVRRWRARPR
jgi:hypothetical protein